MYALSSFIPFSPPARGQSMHGYTKSYLLKYSSVEDFGYFTASHLSRNKTPSSVNVQSSLGLVTLDYQPVCSTRGITWCRMLALALLSLLSHQQWVPLRKLQNEPSATQRPPEVDCCHDGWSGIFASTDIHIVDALFLLFVTAHITVEAILSCREPNL